MRNLRQKSHKPTCTLNAARFFCPNHPNARHRLGSWAISVDFIFDHLSRMCLIAYRVCVYKYTRISHIKSIFFGRFFPKYCHRFYAFTMNNRRLRASKMLSKQLETRRTSSLLSGRVPFIFSPYLSER